MKSKAAEANRLRAAGHTVKEVMNLLGASRASVYGWTNEKSKHAMQRSKVNWFKRGRGLVWLKLKCTRDQVKRSGGMPCTSTVDEILPTLKMECEICGSPPKNRNSLCLDHNHLTGAFRGWLCGNCNRALGLLGEDPRTLRKAAEYLLKEIL